MGLPQATDQHEDGFRRAGMEACTLMGRQGGKQVDEQACTHAGWQASRQAHEHARMHGPFVGWHAGRQAHAAGRQASGKKTSVAGRTAKRVRKCSGSDMTASRRRQGLTERPARWQASGPASTRQEGGRPGHAKLGAPLLRSLVCRGAHLGARLAPPEVVARAQRPSVTRAGHVP